MRHSGVLYPLKWHHICFQMWLWPHPPVSNHLSHVGSLSIRSQSCRIDNSVRIRWSKPRLWFLSLLKWLTVWSFLVSDWNECLEVSTGGWKHERYGELVNCWCCLNVTNGWTLWFFFSCRLEVFKGLKADTVLRNFTVFEYTENKVSLR